MFLVQIVKYVLFSLSHQYDWGEIQNEEEETSSLTFPEYKSPFSSSFSFLFRPPSTFSRIRFCAQRKKTVLGGGRQIGEGGVGTKKTLSSREEEEICRHPSLLFPHKSQALFHFFSCWQRGLGGGGGGRTMPPFLLSKGVRQKGGARKLISLSSSSSPPTVFFTCLCKPAGA